MKILTKSTGESSELPLETVMFRHRLSKMFGWTYMEINQMRLKDAITAVFVE